MAKQFLHTLTVKGIGIFPIDMLRYDFLAPHQETDSGKIGRTMRYEKTEPVQVSRFAAKDWTPTMGRWLSFSWRVIRHVVRTDRGDKIVFEDNS